MDGGDAEDNGKTTVSVGLDRSHVCLGLFHVVGDVGSLRTQCRCCWVALLELGLESVSADCELQVNAAVEWAVLLSSLGLGELLEGVATAEPDRAGKDADVGAFVVPPRGIANVFPLQADATVLVDPFGEDWAKAAETAVCPDA
ncbi:MAG: hypothetical protein FJ224_11535 [Lentisphaerae bacterium]|nr:hypothetical protein [Lentisphaerota bacterium]